MAEVEATAKSKVATWIKGGFTAVFGIVWGAVLMYLSPLVSNVIKPARPVANFSIDQGQGLVVTFQNRTLGATEGWWDFGDGSALEPFSPHQASLPHTYAKAGSYAAKLTVHNLIGDESDRTVNVVLDASGGTGGTTPPSTATEVASLEVVSMRTDTYAPATFHVVGKVNNADLCVWAIDDRPLHLVPEPPASQERYLTFKEPGKHTIKFAAVRGKQVVEKVVSVQVEQAPAGMAAAAMAVVNVTYEAVQVESRTVHQNAAIEFPQPFTGSTQPFQKEILPANGFKIVKAELAQAIQHPGVKDVKLTLTPDGKVLLTCELVKVSHSASHSSHRAVAELVLTEQRRGAVTQQAAEPMAVALRLPGSTIVPIPPPPHGWETKQHKISFDLLEGANPLTKSPIAIPASGGVKLQNHLWHLKAIEVDNQVRFDVESAAPPASPAAVQAPAAVGVGPNGN